VAAKGSAKRLVRFVATSLAVVVLAATPVAASEPDPLWVSPDARGAPVVRLHFFWAEGCPHCHEAQDFLRELEAQAPWLRIESHEITRSGAGRARYKELAARVGEEPRFVPAFFFCGRMLTGFSQAGGSGEALRRDLEACRSRALAREPLASEVAAAGPAPAVRIPGLGHVEADRLSLPVLTVILAGLDAFNPCAFFVLLFLLSLLVHAHSRARILVVGGTFVLFSGLVYFAFMAAWLNAFLVMRELRLVTTLAGALAVAIGALNVKDYLWLGRGASLSIPEAAKPGLYRRMRQLATAAHWPSMLAGTVALALAANAYELLCTAGFPMVFTRVLTLEELPTASYYLYLALYNVVYVIPLAAVVVAFAATLGSRKLGEAEGRALKLLSGLMMLGLGTLLLVAPDRLQNPVWAAGLLAASVATAAALGRATRRWRSSPDRQGKPG